MTTNPSVRTSAAKTRKSQPPKAFNNSAALFRLVGYSFLIVGLLEVFYVIIPIRLDDLTWRFQTMTRIVDRSSFLLIGLMLIFYGSSSIQNERGKKISKFSSWLSFALGTGFIVMVLMGIFTTKGIQEQRIDLLDTAFAEEMTQVDQFEQRLNELSDAELSSILEEQGISSEQVSTSQARETALLRLAKAQNDSQGRLESQKILGQRSLMKRSAKLILGALLYGTAFICMWRLTLGT